MTAAFLVVASALLVHELGHVLAASPFGIRPHGLALARRPLRIGVRLEGRDPRAPLARWAGVVITAGGPAANLALAVGLLVAGLSWAAMLSALFGLANLLPLPGSDGRRLLNLLR